MEQKNIAVALLFSVILGPVGLLYSSFGGGVTMILIGLMVGSAKLMTLLAIVWLISCIWAVGAANRYNQNIIRMRYEEKNNNKTA